jgi:NAD(P)-dependent dehydrogenase (short-subunit alcohol dehydrogenase family)
LPGTVATTEAADGLVTAALEAFGRLDILVTNAGILRDRVLWKTDEDFDAVIGVHLRGTFTCARPRSGICASTAGDG